MADTTKANAMEEVVQFLVSAPSPEQIIAFHPSQAATDRLYELIEMERAGTITAEERAELESCIFLEHMTRLIKAEAHRVLQWQVS